MSQQVIHSSEPNIEQAPSVPGPTAQQGKSSKKAPGAFLTISEVAETLGLQQHVLRFWETKFTQVKPLKRGGGRRYYRPEDVAVLKRIYHLLYVDKYTIKGAQKLLKGLSKLQIIQNEKEPSSSQRVPSNDTRSKDVSPQEALDEQQQRVMKEMLQDLRELRSLLAK